MNEYTKTELGEIKFAVLARIDNSQEAMDTLFYSVLRLVVKAASGFRQRFNSSKLYMNWFMDMVLEGNLAILEHIREYDPTRGKLSTLLWKHLHGDINWLLLKDRAGKKRYLDNPCPGKDPKQERDATALHDLAQGDENRVIFEDTECYYVHLVQFNPPKEMHTFTSGDVSFDTQDITNPLLMEEPICYKCRIEVSRPVRSFEIEGSSTMLENDENSITVLVDAIYESVKILK